jgi:hypothetical protein
MGDLRIAIMSWDWRGQPDLTELARAVREVSGGGVHLVEADTGSDQYAIVLSDQPLDKAAATDAYRRWWEGGGQ